jgi:dTDP-4-dehydrorhamnose reductase
MSKILITGGNGMLGSELKKHFKEATALEGKAKLDLTNFKLLENYLKEKSFDIIIHTAAYTNLKYNEDNPLKAKNLHCNVVDIFNKYSKKLIFISAQGKNYDSVYYKTKLMGEAKVIKKKSNLIIRTNIYGDGGLIKWAKNELINGNKINGYSNCVFNPVSTEQLSTLILKKLNDLTGIINVGSKSIISKYDFLKILALNLDLDPNLIFPIKKDVFLDLSVPLSGKFFKYELLDGIISLQKNE